MGYSHRPRNIRMTGQRTFAVPAYSRPWITEPAETLVVAVDEVSGRVTQGKWWRLPEAKGQGLWEVDLGPACYGDVAYYVRDPRHIGANRKVML